jgi:hypothetical protein
MKHCVFSTTGCEENRIEIEVELAKEVAGWLQLDLNGKYGDCKITVVESDNKTEVYITSDNLFALINMCMDYAREEACRRACDMGPYRN